jgi:prephenate dehydratase
VKPPEVAFQGERGAFSERAARSYFGEGVATFSSPSFRAVFEKVASGASSHGMIPIENSLTGSIHPIYDLLLEFNVSIVGEFKLRVVHNLITLPGVTIDSVRRIYAHPQAAAQCERFLRPFSAWTIFQVYDTAGSVKMIRDEGARDAAAIASFDAAQEYGMQILREAIENDPQNYTRFIVIEREAKPLRSADKVSIVYGTQNEPGALLRTLQIFADRGINLCKLESRPIAVQPWEYLFYVDLTGSMAEANVAEALAKLQSLTRMTKVLGCYSSAQ